MEILLVLVGALVSLASTTLTQFFASQRETRAWERQVTIERERRAEEKQNQHDEELQEALGESVRAVTVFMAAAANNPEDTTRAPDRLVEDIVKWVSKLLVKNPSRDLMDGLDWFSRSPTERSAEVLWVYVLQAGGLMSVSTKEDTQ